jgi:hypothetical protein
VCTQATKWYTYFFFFCFNKHPPLPASGSESAYISFISRFRHRVQLSITVRNSSSPLRITSQQGWLAQFISLHLSLHSSGVRLERCRPFSFRPFCVLKKLLFLGSISCARTLFSHRCSSVWLRRQSSVISRMSRWIGHLSRRYQIL